LEARLRQHLQRKLSQEQQSLAWLSKRLKQQHPGQKLARNSQRLDELESRLNQAMQTKIRHNKNLIEAKIAKLWQYSPAVSINNYQQKQDYLSKRLIVVTRHKLEQLNQRLLSVSQTLHAVSPLATLNRGYALVIHKASGQIIRSTEQLKVDDTVETRLAEGRFTSQISSIDRGEIQN
jgi:exodeoxyribonuclease VII large subunit